MTETKRVLKEITFSAEEGRVLGVLGENGSGKSTLEHVIDDIIFLRAGEIAIEGAADDLRKSRAQSIDEMFDEVVG